mmetsp:Transcript_6863/g.23344  ORF Transcript_6863/g.23344 Transcript_6863/m.23344 type:complete len:224 (+) Transcript_6863:1133-1804(+)
MRAAPRAERVRGEVRDEQGGPDAATHAEEEGPPDARVDGREVPRRRGRVALARVAGAHLAPRLFPERGLHDVAGQPFQKTQLLQSLVADADVDVDVAEDVERRRLQRPVAEGREPFAEALRGHAGEELEPGHLAVARAVERRHEAREPERVARLRRQRGPQLLELQEAALARVEGPEDRRGPFDLRDVFFEARRLPAEGPQEARGVGERVGLGARRGEVEVFG